MESKNSTPTCEKVDAPHSEVTLGSPEKKCRVGKVETYCTLALLSRITGHYVPIALFGCRPQVEENETQEDIDRVFKLNEWPLQLNVDAVCPAKDVITKYRDSARIVIFVIKHEDPPAPSTNEEEDDDEVEDDGVEDPPEITYAPSTNEEDDEVEDDEDNIERTSQADVPPGTAQIVDTSQPPETNNFSQPETNNSSGRTAIRNKETNLQLTLKQLHEKGTGLVINLRSNTLLIVAHNGKPLGILIQKLELIFKSHYNLPPPRACFCIMCRKHLATHAFIKCGHLCICSNDIQTYVSSERGKLCPVCKSQYEGILRVYM